MELTASKKGLLNSLGSISGATKKNVLVEATDKLNISTTDGIISIMSSCDADIKKEGSACVEYSRLLGFAKNYQGESIKLKATKAGWLNIEGKNIKLRLPGAKDEKPVVEFKSLDNIVKIDYNEMKNAINMTEFAIGQNKSREGMLGLNMAISSNKILFTSADGFIISRYELSQESSFEKTVLIPRKSAIEINKIIDKDCVVSVDDNNIQVESDSLKFKSRLLGASFPSLDKLIDDDNSNKINVKRESLESFINILNSIASVEKDPVVKFIFGGNKIQLISKRLDTGDGDGVVDCDYSDDEISIGFNIQFLKKVVTNFSKLEDEFMTFRIKGSDKPVVVTSGKADNYKAAIMPVRLTW